MTIRSPCGHPRLGMPSFMAPPGPAEHQPVVTEQGEAVGSNHRSPQSRPERKSLQAGGRERERERESDLRSSEVGSCSSQGLLNDAASSATAASEDTGGEQKIMERQVPSSIPKACPKRMQHMSFPSSPSASKIGSEGKLTLCVGRNW